MTIQCMFKISVGNDENLFWFTPEWKVSVYCRIRLAVRCHGPTKSVGEERGGVLPRQGRQSLPRSMLAGEAPYFLLNQL